LVEFLLVEGSPSVVVDREGDDLGLHNTEGIAKGFVCFMAEGTHFGDYCESHVELLDVALFEHIKDHCCCQVIHQGDVHEFEKVAIVLRGPLSVLCGEVVTVSSNHSHQYDA
jgi:hypothetical protein